MKRRKFSIKKTITSIWLIVNTVIFLVVLWRLTIGYSIASTKNINTYLQEQQKTSIERVIVK